MKSAQDTAELKRPPLGRSVVLNSGYTLKSPEEIKKILCADLVPRDPDLVGLGRGLRRQCFLKSAPHPDLHTAWVVTEGSDPQTADAHGRILLQATGSELSVLFAPMSAHSLSSCGFIHLN